MRKFVWSVMTVLALLIALYAIAVLVVPGFGPPFVAERRSVMPLAVMAHLFGGAIALALGPFQLNSRLRLSSLNRHRWTGRGYVIAVLIGGLGGLTLSFGSLEGLVTHFGFGLLAVLWLTSTSLAYLRIRAGDQAAHRRWMFRSYSLTLAAVMLRIYLPLSQMAGVPFGEAYQVISWLAWVPNLILAEWFFIPRNYAPATTTA